VIAFLIIVYCGVVLVLFKVFHLKPDGMFSRSEFTYDAERDVYICPASGTTCHNLKSAALARSSHDARARRSRRSLAASMKMRATMPGH